MTIADNGYGAPIVISDLGAPFIVDGYVPSPTYDPDAQALFDRMTVQPDADRKVLINTTITKLKSAGVWSLLDALYFEAAHDAQGGRLNWVADAYNLVEVNGPLFTVDRGYYTDGVASQLTTGFVPSPATGHKMQVRDLHIAIFHHGPYNASNVASFGASHHSARGVSANPCSASWHITVSLNGGGVATPIPNSNPAFLFGSTEGAGICYMQFNADIAYSGATTVSTLPTLPLLLGGTTATSFREMDHLFASFGAALTRTQALSLNTIVREYLVAVGAI